MNFNSPPKTVSTTRQRLVQVLTTWPFLVSLLALLLNDSWLKYALPGPVTGKLSDVAGIGIVTLLLLAACPRRLPVFALVAVGFAFWKSPLSQPLIDAMNAYLPFPTARTIDYTDLLALLIMPLYACVAADAGKFRVLTRGSRLLWPPVAVATAFALMATSVPRLMEVYQVRQADPAAELNRTVMASAVAEVAADFDLVCADCVDPLKQARFDGKGLYLSYSYPDARTIDFEVESYPSSVFVRGTVKKATKLKAALKKRLSRVYTNLEYVELAEPRVR